MFVVFISFSFSSGLLARHRAVNILRPVRLSTPYFARPRRSKLRVQVMIIFKSSSVMRSASRMESMRGFIAASNSASTFS